MSASSHRTQSEVAPIRLIDWISFLFGFADAFLIYLASSYVQQAVETDNVSPFYLGTFSIVLLLSFYLHTFIRVLGRTSLLSILLFFLASSAAVLTIIPASVLGILVLSFHIICINMAWIVLDIVLEDYSEDQRSGRIRGLYLTIMNAGFLLGPFLASRTLSRFEFSGVFFGTFMVYSIVFLLATLGLRRTNNRFHHRIRPLEIVARAKASTTIMNIYSVAFLLDFFYTIMIIYMPFRLREIGFDWNAIGVMFTFMLLPFVLLQYPIGRLADKRYGEKGMLILSILLMIVSSTLVAVSASTSMLWWMLILVLTRVSAASMEVLRDSYFYKHVNGEDGDLIAFFRTARSASNIVSAILAGILLLFFPVQSVFWLITAVALVTLLPASMLEDSRRA